MARCLPIVDEATPAQRRWLDRFDAVRWGRGVSLLWNGDVLCVINRDKRKPRYGTFGTFESVKRFTVKVERRERTRERREAINNVGAGI